MDLRPKELSKIECGKRHFKELGSRPLKIIILVERLGR